MANRWRKNGNSDRFIFLGSKITVDGGCSNEIKICLLLGRKAMTNLDSIFKSRDITFPANVHVVKAMIFPIVMYRYERQTIKRLNAKELMPLNCIAGEVSWKTRRSNQSILKEINPEYSSEGLMLKPQYFGHSCKEPTHWKRLWCWERLKAGGEGDYRGWDGWMASLTQLTWVWANSRR